VTILSASTHPKSTIHAPILNLSPEKQNKWFAGKQSNWRRYWLRLGYTEPPDMTGKRLLDVGSGLGGNTAAAARAGAHVVALEPDAEVQQIATSLIKNDLGAFSSNVEFVTGSIENYRDFVGFDYILCDEVFEHLLDFSSALDAMYRLLRPNGRVVSGWGPLWHSPVGGHQLMLYMVPTGPFGLSRKLTLKSMSTGQTRRRLLPYSHRMFTGRALRLNNESTQGTEITTIQQAGMNGYDTQQFKEMIEKSPLNIVEWRENQGEHAAYKILRRLSRFPGCKNLFTSNIYAVLVKSTS
jgi:SAM-dependent methyltransferase